MKALEKLLDISEKLKPVSIGYAEKESELLIRHELQISALELFRDNPELKTRQLENIGAFLNRRITREPFQYITGYEEFMDLKIVVGPGVLIPRPETELMAEQAIKALRSIRLVSEGQGSSSPCTQAQKTELNSSFKILDLCTGSGCLALAIAKEFPDFEVYGTDISETAIEYAHRNAESNKIANVEFIAGDLFEPLPEFFTITNKLTSNVSFPLVGNLSEEGLRTSPMRIFARSRSDRSDKSRPYAHELLSKSQLLTFDLIISNPPYIKTDDIKNLQPEIKDWEPAIALDGGKDGMDFYRKLIPKAAHFLKKDGLIMLEIGEGQARDVSDMLENSGYEMIDVITDYAGIERIIKAKWTR
ncbi:MAG: peptide chain release factor N(5)-glutamine methyltransferase [Nitrospirae bacterium]|nr:peptide chain release factor N(5)-glutamine methyltransferase [Nitrospirota bacterium]